MKRSPRRNPYVRNDADFAANLREIARLKASGSAHGATLAAIERRTDASRHYVTGEAR